MKDLWQNFWYAEPVVFVGSLVAAWTAIVAFDQASDSWAIPLWLYVVAVPLVAFLTGITRRRVTPVE